MCMVDNKCFPSVIDDCLAQYLPNLFIMEKNHNRAIMKNLLMSTAVGDIAGSAYEGRTHRTKDYGKVKLFSSRAHFTDDTVLTFACAEAFTSFALSR